MPLCLPALNFFLFHSLSPALSPNYLHIARSKNSLVTAFNLPKLEASASPLEPDLKFEKPETDICPNAKIVKKKKKLRPSFYEITHEHWSKKFASQRTKLPWQESAVIEKPSQPSPPILEPPVLVEHANVEDNPTKNKTIDMKVSLHDHLAPAPWDHGSKPRNFDFYAEDKRTIRVDGEEGTDACGKGANSIEVMIVEELKTTTEEQSISGKSNIHNVPCAHGFLANGQRSNYSGSSANITRDSIQLPWERRGDTEEEMRKSNIAVAEATIPEPELRRLQNIALKKKERMKVGASGITKSVVDDINQKWKEEEVIKIKFEGPPAINMKRTHEILERKTGGLVIWRSGSLIVLYRGMTYNLPCAQKYRKQAADSDGYDLIPSTKEEPIAVEATNASSANQLTASDAAAGELLNIDEIENLLEELGPRYKDWSGAHPLPVDADLLPRVVPGYRPPFRLLPYGTQPCLHNKMTTSLRRFARTMHPHFALGRSRQHQGLAEAMVKLWEKSAIAKIAIKRGVPNTHNEIMAEELKRLTGGKLLSRNKEYIVFYRGNDFMPPEMKNALIEQQRLMRLKQDEEEEARLRASSLNGLKPRNAKRPLLAGTLAETVEAKSRWGNEPSVAEREEMMRDEAWSRHASLVRYLEKKLALAQAKVRKAEKALRKVQSFLNPAGLPTDLETITDEERFLFRKLGLSMKPYLFLGRRGVFDGIIENMHLHWKYRELVKIMVKGQSFPQVKHIAISLEAESGGILISLDKTTKGYAIIVYRGKNYMRPASLKPKNLLTKRQALARSIELQRREALNHHILNLRQKIKTLKSELEQMEAGKDNCDENLYSRLGGAYSSDEDVDDEGEEAYLETYSEDGDNRSLHGSDHQAHSRMGWERSC